MKALWVFKDGDLGDGRCSDNLEKKINLCLYFYIKQSVIFSMFSSFQDSVAHYFVYPSDRKLTKAAFSTIFSD